MHIMNGAQKEIINVAHVERFCLCPKEDAVLIVASYSADRVVTVARYKDKTEAHAALYKLFSAICGGESCFVMPDSLLYDEENWKRDARAKRRGGS